jgi:ABC-type phosphate transport system ATPase subunit
MKMRTILRSSERTVSISTLTKHAMPTRQSLSSMRKTKAIMAIIDGEVVTPEEAEEAKEEATEVETIAAEVGMVTEEMTAVTKEVMRNVATEARVEIQDNQETMKKITR